ncbi:DNA-directed RNA polymerase subunit beta [Yasminevirus sp. GU-2018]|uniref:DNA-directed RNA polymerase n=1 Tax=Yasminevirus sp. GU-2018 TaxID=2420051 RepID=A0A5K0U9F3_9VIRU|nr:DNA-directed RNA polymerase subunit beta [Yasminevirus sp. GU-2018]
MTLRTENSKRVMPQKSKKSKSAISKGVVESVPGTKSTKMGRATKDSTTHSSKQGAGQVVPSDLHNNIIEQYRLAGDDNNLTTDDVFRLLDLYFYKEFYTYRHLHESYDKFIDDTIPRFFTEGQHAFSEFITEDKFIRHKFKFENVRAESPKLSNKIDPMFPADARHLAMPYSMTIYADVTQLKEVIDVNTSGKNNTVTTVVGKTERNKEIMIIPTMVRSKYCNLNVYKEETRDECKFDPGGYFIVNGSEKVVICQDSMIRNHPMVFVKKNSNISNNVVQVNSKSNDPMGMMQSISIKIKKDGVMIVKVPILYEVNVMVLFRALGIESDRDIIEMCAYDKTDHHMIELLRASLETCVNDNDDQELKIQTQEEAIDYLITKMKVSKNYTTTNQKTRLEQKRMHLMDLLKTSLLPHIEGTPSNPYREKAYYLGYMINKLLKVELGRAPVDNRDAYTKKRVENIRELLEEIMLQQYKNNMNECSKQFTARMGDDGDAAEPYNVIHQFKAGTFEQGFKASLMLGNWPRKKGVSQMLQRFSYMQLLSFLSRIDSQSGTQASSKLTKPRQVDPSSIPFLCVISTPEHAKIGLIKHLSMIGSITIGDKDNTELVKEFILTHPSVKDISEVPVHELKNMFKVFLNGEWLKVVENSYNVGDSYTDNPAMRFYADAKVKKISGEFNPQMTSVVFDYKDNEIRFNTDSGRLYRPVIRINGDNEMMLTKEMIDKISLKATDKGKINDWDEFYMQAPYPIEFIDSEEQPYMLIAEDRKTLNFERKKIIESEKYVFKGEESKIVNRYDDKFYLRFNGVELHPSVLLGEIATNVPFCNRNCAPRNIFQYAQGRQGMGIYCTVYRSRTDISYVLYHPEVPIVNTRTSKYTYTDILPPGSNAVVAIACYSGLLISPCRNKSYGKSAL